MNTGERIRQRRIELGLTQEELAQRLGNKSRASVCTVERGKEDLTTERLRKYAQALECAPEDLMDPTDRFIHSPDFIQAMRDGIAESEAMERRWEALQDLTDTEVEIINRYRDADDHTRRLIEYMLRIGEAIDGNR